MDNYGVIIRHLRRLAGLTLRDAATQIERSVGWLSEIENGHGLARISESEFHRIVDVLGGARHRPMFKIWVANHKNRERANTTFEGAVLKFVRTKKGLALHDAARACSLSSGYLSKIESGLKPVTVEMRNRILTAYGYRPSSWKNLATDPVRSKAVPLIFKLKILLNALQEQEVENVFHYVHRLVEQSARSGTA